MKRPDQEPEVTALVVATPGPSRRGWLGGVLATALAAVLLPEHLRRPRGPDRWKGKTRWIGHC
ncbi:MAG TPA: hypothetical protein VM734_33345 [Kofleriaceae bacterium]|jgi:hypothetical protein|nr:hypothetical protein [Kofleriaceae bacterium]